MNDQALHTFCRSRRARLQIKEVGYQWRDLVGNHDRTRRRQTRHVRSQIGAEAVDVILVGIQIHQAAMHSDSRNDVHAESTTGLLAESGNLTSDF